VPDILPRRRVLAASAAALPTLLATAGCRSAEVFAGPDPLAGRPSLSPDVITLQAVIAAERVMISLYQAAAGAGLRASGGNGLVSGLLAQHQQHLSQLEARLVIPAGQSSPSPSPASSSPAAVTGRVTIARLQAAEQASAAGLVQRLATVPPALAQLFASIAASDATHSAALGG
jgi:hypothetical protein